MPCMQPLAQLGATRSSHKWQEQPGNWDRLNTRALYSSDNEYGIPTLPAATVIPDALVAYNDRYRCEAAAANTAVHFFLDDYRFETMWTKPERGLSRVAKVGIALTPDFSLWAQMPPVMQMWQTYRARWCGAWMLQHDIPVIPTISWSDRHSYRFAFAGITVGSVVAISTVGVTAESRHAFQQGLEAMLGYILPQHVLCYGKIDESICHGVPVTQYPTRWR